MGAAGAAVARPDTSARRPVDRPSGADQRGVVADSDRLTVAGPARLLRALEDRLQPAPTLVGGPDLGSDSGRIAPRLRSRREPGVGARGGLHGDPGTPARGRSAAAARTAPRGRHRMTRIRPASRQTCLLGKHWAGPEAG